jgi:hypothetical protein
MNTEQLARFLNNRQIMQSINVYPENPLPVFPFCAFGKTLNRHMKLTLVIITENRNYRMLSFLLADMKQSPGRLSDSS